MPKNTLQVPGWKRIARKSLSVVAAITIVMNFGGSFILTAPVAHAANPAASLDQCRNDEDGSSQDCVEVGGPLGWEHGNAGSSNSHFAEGESIPYRAILTNLPTDGTVITLTLGYDIKHSDKHAVDFLTHYDRISENVDPIDGVSGTFSAPSTFPIPTPSSVGSPVAGQPTTSFNSLPAGEKVMTLWNGTLSNITYATQGDLNASQSETTINVTFTASNSTAVLSWGGHIGSRLDWGVGNSAGGISGSPYHMRIKNWNLGNLGNEDRSLSANAIVVPATIIVEKQTIPDGSQELFTFSGAVDGDIGDGQTLSLADLNPDTYDVTESSKQGWTLTSIVCDDMGQDGVSPSSVDLNTRTATFDVSEGENVTCVFTNTRNTGDLKVIKIDEGQNPMPGVEFNIDGQTYNTDVNGEILVSGLETGDYGVEETVPANYSWDSVSGVNCTNANPSMATVVTDETTTCTFTNTRDTGSITVNKNVDTDGDGNVDDFGVTNWTWDVNGGNQNYATGSTQNVNTGNYTISEDQQTNYHVTDLTCDNTSYGATESQEITVGKDQNVVCTYTNTRDTGTITFEKIIIGLGAQIDEWLFDFTIEGVPGIWNDGDQVTLPTGTYTVYESGPDGYTNSNVSGICSPDGDQQGSLTVTENGGTCTFTNIRDTGSLTGLKYNDLNGNGTLDAGEPGVSGVDIALSNGASTTTDSNGGFSFTDLPTGNYDVSEIVPTDWINTTPTEQNVDVTKDGEAYAEFGNFELIDITVCKVIDADGYSETTNDQTLTADWTVYLSDGETVDEQVTDENGCYTWSDLGPGSYEVAENTPEPWHEIVEGSHDFGAITSGESYEYTFVNARDRGTVTINKIVHGGTADPSDWTFILHANQEGLEDVENIQHGVPVQVPTGSYTVTEEGPSQYSFLYAFGDCSEDGDIYLNVSTEGATCTFVNETYAVHGQKWNDENDNSIWDEGELPLNGWTISIYQGETLINSMVTQNHDGQDGWYWFDDLKAGSYEICETEQAGWNQTFPLNENGNCHTIEVPLEFSYEQEGPPQLDNSTCSLFLNREFQITAYQNAIASEALCNFGNTPEVVTLGIAKVNDQEIAQGGDGILETTETITYRIDWNVDGNSDATDVVLTDIIPDELNLNVASISDSGTWNAATRTITWDFGTQVPGSNGFVTYTATVKVPVTDGTVILNTARLSASNTDPTFVEADSTVSVEVAPILGIVKSVNVEFANPGDTVTYTIIVTNTGDGTAFNVTVTDTLPDGFTFEDGTSTKTFALGNMGPGESQTLTYEVTVGDNVEAGDYDNVAQVKADNHDPLEDSATVEVRIPAVLGATVPETGAGVRDAIVFLTSLLFIFAGVLFVRQGRMVKAK